MSDREPTSEDETFGWIHSELADTKEQLMRERSFYKVYWSAGMLAFLYGLCYGVYLSK